MFNNFVLKTLHLIHRQLKLEYADESISGFPEKGNSSAEDHNIINGTQCDYSLNKGI